MLAILSTFIYLTLQKSISLFHFGHKSSTIWHNYLGNKYVQIIMNLYDFIVFATKGKWEIMLLVRFRLTLVSASALRFLVSALSLEILHQLLPNYTRAPLDGRKGLDIVL